MKKIIKIITALGNPVLNLELKKIDNFELLNNDIQYKEGILEILEKNKEINYLIISQLLPGNINLEKLIENILEKNNKIKIILILENINNELEKVLLKKGVFRIFYNNKINICDITKIINENEKMEKYNEEIRKEIDELKKYIKNNSYKKNNKKEIKNKIIKKINYKNKINIFNKLIINKNKKLIKNKIISICGNNGSGKSLISVLLANNYKKYFNNILIIDFDILNNSLHTILGVKKYSEKIRKIIDENCFNNSELNIENLIIKINKKIDLISGINLIFDNKSKISENEFINIFEKLNKKYELIIIDTSSECFFEYTKELLKISNLCVFLTEPNLVELNKSKRILNMYCNNWNINKNKIKIIFNKINNYGINKILLKTIYSDFEIIGNINYENKINLFINSNFKNIILENKLIKKLQIIGNKILYE